MYDLFMKHILSADQFSKDDILSLFRVANRIRHFPEDWTDRLRGKIMGTLFYEPSLRTKWSSETAMLKLGGQVISEPNAFENSSAKKGEVLSDTFRVVSKYVDILVVRHPEPNIIQNNAKYSSVPVINAGDGSNSHPTQALLDLYTIYDHFSLDRKLKILFTGDLVASRTIHSLKQLLNLFDFEILSAVPDLGGTKEENCIFESQIPSLLPEIDILYMTRTQQERPYHSNSLFMLGGKEANSMKPKSIIMHPLPRINELPNYIDDNPRAVYFNKQVKNGLWIRMALIYSLLKDDFYKKGL